MNYVEEYYINLIENEFNGRYNPDEEKLESNKPVNRLKHEGSGLVSTYQHELFIHEKPLKYYNIDLPKPLLMI